MRPGSCPSNAGGIEAHALGAGIVAVSAIPEPLPRLSDAPSLGNVEATEPGCPGTLAARSDFDHHYDGSFARDDVQLQLSKP